MISYIGGKNKISSFIIPHIPKDIETYVECFSGAYWVFFKMNISDYPNLKSIVYNDINKLNWNLFKCVKNHQRLLEECEKIPVQQKDVFPTPEICGQLFNEYQKEIYASDISFGETPNYEIAAKYAYVLSSVFSGANPKSSKFVDLKGKYHSKFTSFKNKLKDERWQKLFESITDICNSDFESVINNYDGPKTYFYADPPYYIVGEGNYYSNHEFGRDDHERLIIVLKNIKGRFGLSYYDFPELSQWLPKDEYRWESKEFAKAASAKKGVKQNMGEELLIMNY